MTNLARHETPTFVRSGIEKSIGSAHDKKTQLEFKSLGQVSRSRILETCGSGTILRTPTSTSAGKKWELPQRVEKIPPCARTPQPNQKVYWEKTPSSGAHPRRKSDLTLWTVRHRGTDRLIKWKWIKIMGDHQSRRGQIRHCGKTPPLRRTQVQEPGSW